MTEKQQTEHAESLERWAKDGKEGRPPVLAATVIVLRDGREGLEALMLRRNSKISFGGMWVFPGGKLDEGDWHGVEPGDELGASRRAAARESIEECRLELEPHEMVPFAHWTPPPVTPKRFLTWFFAARASDGEVVIDDGEIKASEWLRPLDALAKQAAKEIELAPPTFVTVTDLARFASVDEALAVIEARTPERFQTRIGVLEGLGPVAMWHGDAGYESGDATAAGPRHRLTMRKKGRWDYERTT